jgi:shikimate kinase
MPRIFLVGPRASGKTTVGRLLAGRLGLPFMDTDELVQRQAGCCVADLVTREGWQGFRARESGALAGLVSAGPAGAVVSTGGGIVLEERNRSLMRSCGMVIFLDVPPSTLVERLGADPQADLRPALAEGDLETEVSQVMAVRLALYHAACHHAVDGTPAPEAVCRQVLELLGKSPA